MSHSGASNNVRKIPVETIRRRGQVNGIFAPCRKRREYTAALRCL
jgi:hypothetical protein